MLCFTLKHEGVVHECVYVSYVWPEDSGKVEWTRDQDGINLVTKYVFLPTKTYEVRPVSDVLYRAPLVHPPRRCMAENAHLGSATAGRRGLRKG